MNVSNIWIVIKIGSPRLTGIELKVWCIFSDLVFSTAMMRNLVFTFALKISFETVE